MRPGQARSQYDPLSKWARPPWRPPISATLSHLSSPRRVPLPRSPASALSGLVVVSFCVLSARTNLAPSSKSPQEVGGLRAETSRPGSASTSHVADTRERPCTAGGRSSRPRARRELPPARREGQQRQADQDTEHLHASTADGRNRSLAGHRRRLTDGLRGLDERPAEYASQSPPTALPSCKPRPPISPRKNRLDFIKYDADLEARKPRCLSHQRRITGDRGLHLTGVLSSARNPVIRSSPNRIETGRTMGHQAYGKRGRARKRPSNLGYSG